MNDALWIYYRMCYLMEREIKWRAYRTAIWDYCQAHYPTPLESFEIFDLKRRSNDPISCDEVLDFVERKEIRI